MPDSIDPNPFSLNSLQAQIAGLQTLLEATKELAAEKDFDSLLDVIIRRACSALRCERASVFLYDEKRQELYTRKVTRLDGTDEIRLSINKGIAGLVARERRIEHVEDPYSHPEFDPEFDQRLGFRTRNILSAPLIAWGSDEKLLGVLQLLNKMDSSFEELDKQLLHAFAAHTAIAIDRAVLAQHFREKVNLLASLELARQIQSSLLPTQLQDIPGYEIAAVSQPADATGGDYYDVIPLASGKVGIAVADVCGHGFGPSLLMASARAMLRGIAAREPAVEQLMSDLAQAMYADLQRVRRFITFLYGTLDPAEHAFHYANAGHGPVALHLNFKDGEFLSLVDDEARGCPLGWFTETYDACTPVRLAPGDLIVLGTDGIVETRRNGECFGMERLCEFVLRRCRNPLQTILNELVDASITFNESSSLDDDFTLLILRRL
jgi:serine phosphatase RsbU (regulator of sigma subunit)